MVTKVRNFTGHPIRLGDVTGKYFVTLLPEGRARIASRPKPFKTVPIRSGFGGPPREVKQIVIIQRRILDLPDPEPGTIFVVSGIVADTAQREDVWAIGAKIRHGGDVEAGQTLVRFERKDE